MAECPLYNFNINIRLKVLIIEKDNLFSNLSMRNKEMLHIL
jgi:hypothetical protein